MTLKRNGIYYPKLRTVTVIIKIICSRCAVRKAVFSQMEQF